MRVICVDDEMILAEHVAEICRGLPQIREAISFSRPAMALQWLEENTADLALLDIDMPGMNGMELAQRIKHKNPKTAIIFLTGFSEYAVDAFDLRANGYLLKPVDPERLKAELDYAFSERRPERRSRIEAKTFGSFEFLVDGKPLSFKQAKCKELLAYLVDRRGSSVTRAEAFAVLWEDRLYDRPMQKQFDVIIRRLRDTLHEYELASLLEIKGGTMRIRPELIDCDLFRFCHGEVAALNEYQGEYMNGYDWAIMTESYMTWKQEGSIHSPSLV